MKCIKFQKFTYQYFLFLCFFVISFIRRRLTEPLFENKNKKPQFFLLMYFAILSNFIAIIPFLISKYLSKRRNKYQENEKPINIIEKKIDYLHNEETYTSKTLFKYTTIVSIFDFAGEASIFLFYFFNDKRSVISLYSLKTYLILNTVSVYVASYIVLKTYFYKHHWLSMIINIFCVLSSLTIDIIFIVQKKIVDYQYYIFVIIRIVRIIILCFGDVYSKKALYSEFLSPYSLIFYKAIFETIFLAIFSIPFIFIKITEDNIDNASIFVGFKEYFIGKKLLYSILLFFSDFFYELCFTIIIDKFSPNHLPLAYILDAFGQNLIDIIQFIIEHRNIDWTYYTMFFIYTILFIAAMIHNEIFIINKWGLSWKTKLFLNLQLIEEEINKYLIPRDENEDDDDENENIEIEGHLMEEKIE